MKKSLLLVLFFCLFLTGCSEKYPDFTLEGTKWNKDWTILGTNLGIEEFGHGFTLSENPVVLTGDDTFYATWTFGTPEKFVNEEGKDTDLYEAELYVLLYGCADTKNAEAAFSDFLERENSTYLISETKEVPFNNLTYTIISYTCPNENNPYQRGISAFSVHNNYVIVIELLCLDSYTENDETVLKDILNKVHFAKE